MSSSLTVFPALPSNLRTYVSATTTEQPTVKYYTVSNGVWSATTVSGDEIDGVIYEDLGKVVFHDPVAYATSATSTPPVDVRKIRKVSTDGKIAVGAEFYASLGTRVRDTRNETAATLAIEPCWFGLNASGTIGRL
jgi:hypothetical protein